MDCEGLLLVTPEYNNGIPGVFKNAIDWLSRPSLSQSALRGKAVLMISSYLPELFGMCDRLAVMSRGRLSEVRPIEAWTPETVMQAAVGGEEKKNGGG